MVARASVLYYKVYLKVKSLKCAKLGNPGAEFNITSFFFFFFLKSVEWLVYLSRGVGGDVMIPQSHTYNESKA